MIARYTLLLVLAVLLQSFPALAANPDAFEFIAPLAVPASARGTLAVRLPVEALALVRSPGDMRIFDSDGKEVPFFLFRLDGGRTSTVLPVGIFNMGILEGQAQSFEFTRPDEINEFQTLTLAIENTTYNHTVDLYGRDNENEEFRLIKKEMRIVRLLSEDDALRYEFNRLQFPPQRLRYYRAVVHLDAEHHALKITDVLAGQTSEIPVVRETVPVAVQLIDTLKAPLTSIPAFRQRGDSARSTFYELTPPDVLPITILDFTIGGDEYTRRVTLYGFDPKDRRIGAVLASGSLFSLGGESNTSLPFPPSRSKAYVLEIFQGDDVPVQVTAASGQLYAQEARFIIGPGGGALPLTLYFGNAQAPAPQYDIEARVSRMTKPVFVPYTAGAVVRNAAFKPEAPQVPQTERTPAILYGAVGLLVAILLFRLVKLAKELPKDS